jgi:uncharacterized CHY-type Zn-finger protein
VFKKKDLWKNAVTYTTSLGGTYGMHLRNIGEGRGELSLFFDQFTSHETRRIFTEYIHQHLSQKTLPDRLNVRYILTCSTCGTVITEHQLQRRKAWKPNANWLPCSVCEARVSLMEYKEQQPLTASSPRTKEMDQAADIQRDREAAQSSLQGKMVTGDFDVFLCHNTIDKPIVKKIGEQLKEQGILPWLDEWELRPGLSWQQQLEQQLKQIKSAAVFIGKDGIGPWQQQEMYAFLRAFVKEDCPVIPVLLPYAPQKPTLPKLLEDFIWVDFRLQDPDPLQQLLWGITGKRDRE